MPQAQPKQTSFGYGASYQRDMEDFYWESKREHAANHNWNRVRLAERLVSKARALVGARYPRDVTLLDVGCSVGLLVIHFSKLGYASVGIDFDKAAIDTAERLNAADGGNAKFIIGDVGQSVDRMPQVDIALCFDIFEHLHDDELGALLQSLRSALSSRGVVVFHTYPQWYDYLFSMNARDRNMRFPLLLKPFSFLPAPAFERVARIYALLIDIALVTTTGKTWKQRIKKTSHCNPLTVERLTDVFQRANYEIVELSSGFITDEFKPNARARFLKHPITHRSIYGIARAQK